MKLLFAGVEDVGAAPGLRALYTGFHVNLYSNPQSRQSAGRWRTQGTRLGAPVRHTKFHLSCLYARVTPVYASSAFAERYFLYPLAGVLPCSGLRTALGFLSSLPLFAWKVHPSRAYLSPVKSFPGRAKGASNGRIGTSFQDGQKAPATEESALVS